MDSYPVMFDVKYLFDLLPYFLCANCENSIKRLIEVVSSHKCDK